jgi:Ran GTPase-activating protein (RanGAP) involved in mRNA processing and transport
MLALSEAVATSNKLVCLRLSDSNVTDAQAIILADGVARSKSIEIIEIIELFTNAIGDEGAKAIAEAIKRSATLRKIDVWGNGIGDAGAQAIAEAVKVSKSLEEVMLTGNNITSTGAQALAAAVPFSATINFLNIVNTGTGTSPADTDAIEAAIALPRLAYRSSLAFMSAVTLGRADRSVDRSVDGTDAKDSKDVSKLHTPARLFIEQCGDMAIPRIIVRMLTG